MPVMTRAELVARIKDSRQVLRRYDVRSLALFGSAARDRLRARSDVDVLVQFEKATWANYIGLKLYLEDLLGRKVDLVTPNALRPAARPFVEKDLLDVIS